MRAPVGQTYTTIEPRKHARTRVGREKGVHRTCRLDRRVATSRVESSESLRRDCDVIRTAAHLETSAQSPLLSKAVLFNIVMFEIRC